MLLKKIGLITYILILITLEITVLVNIINAIRTGCIEVIAPTYGVHKKVYVYKDEKPSVFLFLLVFFCFFAIILGCVIFASIQGYIHICSADSVKL